MQSRLSNRSFGLSLALAVATWTGAPAHAASPLRAELDGPFHEAVQEEVAVSGSVVVGVAAASALSGAATLAGLVIPAAADVICLTVLSRDGVYFSRNTYRVPADAVAGGGNLMLLPFDGTRRRELINSYGAGDLAVRATPGACDEAATTYLVPTTGSVDETIEVLVNAFGANDVYYRTAGGEEGDCVEFSEGRRTSYDFRCRIPLTALGDGSDRILIIERERYGRPLGEVQLQLQLGAAP